MRKSMSGWERYMEAINACPHHGFDTWLLVSYFYDGMSSSMKQLLETMCRGDFMREVGRMKSQPNALNAKSYEHLVEEYPTIPVVREMSGDQANIIGQFKPITMLHMEIPTIQIGGTIQISPKPRALQYTQPGQASQQASNLEQAIVNLSKVVGDFVGDRNPSMLNSVKESTV
ncbi:hypothetical protein CK203_108526 [Vitis vinifera]|uniref:Retrotransposon gag domain-containing protein n=1 Tax=Vitis vinifera TaxID=29760 RepID=A0A438C5K6_VITVI|nr:hypothetical protein CK203_108526 [Vitis vinifera]